MSTQSSSATPDPVGGDRRFPVPADCPQRVTAILKRLETNLSLLAFEPDERARLVNGAVIDIYEATGIMADIGWPLGLEPTPSAAPIGFASTAQRVSAALQTQHVRQIGPNPLPENLTLWEQFAHLQGYKEAGYSEYLTYENFKTWLSDFIEAIAPSTVPGGSDRKRVGLHQAYVDVLLKWADFSSQSDLNRHQAEGCAKELLALALQPASLVAETRAPELSAWLADSDQLLHDLLETSDPVVKQKAERVHYLIHEIAHTVAAITPSAAPGGLDREFPAWFPEPKTALDKMAVALLAEFQRMEPSHPISRYPTSWIATFVDLARVAISLQPASPVAVQREKIRIDYTNDRGERSIHTISVWGVEWGATEFHPEPQWLITGYDHEKHACRVYALRDIHSWNGIPTRNLSPADLIDFGVTPSMVQAAVEARDAWLANDANDQLGAVAAAVEAAFKQARTAGGSDPKLPIRLILDRGTIATRLRNAFPDLSQEDAECGAEGAFPECLRPLVLEIPNTKGLDVRSVDVECHMAKDIVVSLYDAWQKLPPCSLLSVVGGAIQEIQALRGEATNQSLSQAHGTAGGVPDPARLMKDALFACLANGGENREYGGILTAGGKKAWIRFSAEAKSVESDREKVARLADVPEPGSEERDFWLMAAEQHGFSRADDGVHTATDSDVLKFMSEARKQGQKDVLALNGSGEAGAAGEALTRNKWLDWRGVVEGMDASIETATKAVRQVRGDLGGDQTKDMAQNVCWMIGLDHVWKHVEALRAALAAKEAPSVADALRKEADRLHAKADRIVALVAPSAVSGAGQSAGAPS